MGTFLGVFLRQGQVYPASSDIPPHPFHFLGLDGLATPNGLGEMPLRWGDLPGVG